MWYFTSPVCARSSSWFELAFELVEQLARRLAERVDQHVEAAAVGHARSRLRARRSPPRRMITSSIGIRLSPPSSEKRFWPTYLVCR
jgi:hypothetical protein